MSTDQEKKANQIIGAIHKNDAELIQQFHEDFTRRLLFGEENPEHTCAEPKRIFYQAMIPGNDHQQMVAVNENGYVFAMRDDAPVPLPVPFTTVDKIHIIRGCTGFDF